MAITPRTRDAIGYFHIDTSKPKSNDSEPTYDDDVPYEWFEKEDTLPSVLVLWLKDEKLTSKPLTTLRNLSDKLRPPSHKGSINVKLIGPAGSAVLRALGDELKNDEPLQQDNRAIEVYSPSATISDCDLLQRHSRKLGLFQKFSRPAGIGKGRDHPHNRHRRYTRGLAALGAVATRRQSRPRLC